MYLTLSKAIYLPYLQWGVMFCKGYIIKTNGLNYLSKSNVLSLLVDVT